MYLKRTNHLVLEKSIENQYITAILGPRRVGKTFFVQHYMAQHPARKWVMLNMDRMAERERITAGQLESSITEIALQSVGGQQKIWVVIDEAQKCPELFDQIKILYDRFKDQDRIKFIVTGSAALDLHKLSAESLAGRIELYYLQAFGLREAALLYESSVPADSLFDVLSEYQADPDDLSARIEKISPWRQPLEKALQQVLVWGGFPELLLTETDGERINWLSNYLQTYLEKDVRSIHTITDLNLYRRLLDVLAEQTGSVRDDSRITGSLGCKADTLKKYRGFMEATLLYRDIYPHIGSTLRRLVKSPKGYLLNNGLVSLLTGLFDPGILQKTGMMGHRLENWFLNELQIWTGRLSKPCRIDYWRTASGSEVDFVVVVKPDIFPFEVTLGSEPDRKKIRNLKAFLQEEPRAKWGYYIYQGAFRVSLSDRIFFIPAWTVG